MTMQVGEDLASVGWGLLRVVSGLRSELAERNVYREQLVEGIRQGGSQSAATESRGTNGADRGRDLERLAICGLLAPFAEEQSATRERRRARNAPVGAA
jgi:hypothetical protein